MTTDLNTLLTALHVTSDDHQALANPNLDERNVSMAIRDHDHDPALIADRPALTIIGDRGYVSGSSTAPPTRYGPVGASI